MPFGESQRTEKGGGSSRLGQIPNFYRKFVLGASLITITTLQNYSPIPRLPAEASTEPDKTVKGERGGRAVRVVPEKLSNCRSDKDLDKQMLCSPLGSHGGDDLASKFLVMSLLPVVKPQLNVKDDL